MQIKNHRLKFLSLEEVEGQKQEQSDYQKCDFCTNLYKPGAATPCRERRPSRSVMCLAVRSLTCRVFHLQNINISQW